jgi:two-component system, OmpR family, response regulator
MRNSATPSEARLEAGQLKIFPTSLEAETTKGKRLRLRKKEFELLYFLLHHQNKVVDKTSLLDLIWNYGVYSNSNTLEVHISNLRKKLKYFCETPVIQTVHGAGYRLIV